MRVTKLGSNLYQLTRYPTAFPMNCYLVVEDDGLTLVDTTMSSPAEDVARLLGDLGGNLRRLALTHAHGDHVGGVTGIKARFAGVEVSLGAREVPILAGDTKTLPGEPDAPVKGFFNKVDWTPDVSLNEGDRVGSLEVVLSPGHTPGHIAFLDRRDGALIAGDAFQTRGGMAVSGVVRPLFPFPAMATWHKPTALQSAGALRALNPSLLAVGHGDALPQPGPAMDRAIEVAHRTFA
ncbi:MAG: hypothetical protein QOK05_2380 [Chloroflexota bacterium]|nr:hypothetical protein [Chloroflexota bacterium]